jgi:hypothetical protein
MLQSLTDKAIHDENDPEFSAAIRQDMLASIALARGITRDTKNLL